MATVRDLVAGSMRLIGALDPHEAMDGQQALNALAVLNEIVEHLNLEHLVNPTGVNRVDLVCTPGQQVHTIGASGGNWTTPRPVAIDRAYVLIGNGEFEISVADDQEWSDIPVKGISGIPQKLFYEPEFPLGKVYLWPKPALAYSIALWVWDSIPTFTSLDQPVSLPPAYAKMMRYLLAVELAPEYSKTPSPLVMQIASETKAAIQRLNLITPTLDCDDAYIQSGGSAGTNMAGFLAGG